MMVCKNCGRAITGGSLHFSNRIGNKNGYCDWACMLAALGNEAYEILAKRTNENKVTIDAAGE